MGPLGSYIPAFFKGLKCYEKARFLFIAQVRPELKSVPYFKYGLRISYQFRFLKRDSQKSLPASLFKGRRALLNASDKRFRFFPPAEWRQAYSTGGRKGDLSAFHSPTRNPYSARKVALSAGRYLL